MRHKHHISLRKVGRMKTEVDIGELLLFSTLKEQIEIWEQLMI